MHSRSPRTPGLKATPSSISKMRGLFVQAAPAVSWVSQVESSFLERTAIRTSCPIKRFGSVPTSVEKGKWRNLLLTKANAACSGEGGLRHAGDYHGGRGGCPVQT